MKIYFDIEKLRPDQRQYRQTELELVPHNLLAVGVEIPDGLVESEILTTEGKMITLTLAGLREIVSQCDLVFMGNPRSKQGGNDDIDFDEEN